MKSIQRSYSNFLKSRIKLRVDFILNYTTIFPELILEKDLNYLKSLDIYNAKEDELEYMIKKVSEIEEDISEFFKNFSPHISNSRNIH